MKKYLLTFISLTLFTSELLFAARPVRGEYTVPVSSDLQAYATFPVKYKADNYQAVPNSIIFPLPATLVGETKIIQMQKVNSSDNQWMGPNAKATCITVVKNFNCNVKFNNLSIDSEKVKVAISNSFKTKEEIAGRLEVARAFGNETIGIISYELRGQNR